MMFYSVPTVFVCVTTMCSAPDNKLNNIFFKSCTADDYILHEHKMNVLSVQIKLYREAMLAEKYQ